MMAFRVRKLGRVIHGATAPVADPGVAPRRIEVVDNTTNVVEPAIESLEVRKLVTEARRAGAGFPGWRAFAEGTHRLGLAQADQVALIHRAAAWFGLSGRSEDTTAADGAVWMVSISDRPQYHRTRAFVVRPGGQVEYVRMKEAL